MIMRKIAFVVLMAVGLTACNTNPLEVVVSRCPAVAVVGDAGTLTKFAGEDRMQDDVEYTASILQVNSHCTQEESVSAQVAFDISVKAGEAFRGGAVDVEYFVTILKDNSQIVSKRTFETTIAVNSRGNGRAREVVSQFIPTIEQARRYNYEVLIGFQLSPEDAIYNMQR